MTVEEWEENNEEWSYEPPKEKPEQWSQEQYQEFYDRHIDRRVIWECSLCPHPVSSLKQARDHVRSQHSDRLMEDL